MTDELRLHELLGRRAEAAFQVAAQDTALAVGSGNVQVLGTPVLVAWLEAVTLQAIGLPDGFISLGVHIDVAHVAPSGVGAEVVCRAQLVEVSGVRLGFEVEASNSDGTPVSRGRIDRVVVERERFLARVRGDGAEPA